MSPFTSVCLALGLLAGGENRLWFVELELRGACEAVRIDCGAEGETLLRGPFSSGEDRRLSVPVPVRSPLGSEGLAALALPRAEPLPPGAAARVRVLAWSAPQPAESLTRALGPALGFTRPPGGEVAARAHSPELLLVFVAGAGLLVLRRRLVPSLVLALGSGALALALARGRTTVGAAELVQWSFDGSLALSVRVAGDELAAAQEWLEVTPEGRALTLEWAADGTGRARAEGARLTALGSVPAPALDATRNEGADLSEVWTRDALGNWRGHGAWARGEPLPTVEPPNAGVPPGWLVSALPAGTGVLVARNERGTWLRCLGFPSD